MKKILVICFVSVAVFSQFSLAEENAMGEDVYLYLKSMQGGYWVPGKDIKNPDMGKDLINCLSEGRVKKIPLKKYVKYVQNCMVNADWYWKEVDDA